MAAKKHREMLPIILKIELGHSGWFLRKRFENLNKSLVEKIRFVPVAQYCIRTQWLVFEKKVLKSKLNFG